MSDVTDGDLDLIDSERLFRALGRRFDWVMIIRQTLKGEIHIYRENCHPPAVLDHFREAINEAFEGQGDVDNG